MTTLVMTDWRRHDTTSNIGTDAWSIVRAWYQRSRQRRDLRELDADRLRDIGIDREAARREGSKPFWRA